MARIQETRLSPPFQTGLGPAALLPKGTPRGAESNSHRAGHPGIAQVHVVYPQAERRPAVAISLGQPAATADCITPAKHALVSGKEVCRLTIHVCLLISSSLPTASNAREGSDIPQYYCSMCACTTSHGHPEKQNSHPIRRTNAGPKSIALERQGDLPCPVWVATHAHQHPCSPCHQLDPHPGCPALTALARWQTFD